MALNQQVMQSTAAGSGASGQIDRELHCIRCGYDLRGLPLDHRCPECAAPISLSLTGNALATADPAWLRRLTIGAYWAYHWILASALAGLLSRGPTPSAPATTVASGFAVAAGALGLIGFWLLTAPDPGRRFAVYGDRRRRTARLAMCAACASQVLSPAARSIGPSLVSLDLAIFGLALAIGTWGLTGFLPRLAVRAGEAAFSVRTSRLLWTTTVVGSLYFVGRAADFATPLGALPIIGRVVSGVADLLSLLLFAYLALRGSNILLRFRKLFRESRSVSVSV